MDSQKPLTKADLDALKAGLIEAMRGMLHESETKLLTAFFQYQEHADVIQIEKRLLTQ
jgi:hypothetical protein